MGDSPELLCDHIHFLRAGLFGQPFDRRDYKQFTDVADHIQIDWPALLKGREWSNLSATEIEDATVVTTLQKILNNLPADDRRRLAEELETESRDPNLVRELLSGGGLALAGLSGFKIYLLASTAVGAWTAALGIALPFAIYATISSGLAVVLGPIEWAILGVSALFRLSQANWSRLIPGIVYASYIRRKLELKVRIGTTVTKESWPRYNVRRRSSTFSSDSMMTARPTEKSSRRDSVVCQNNL